MRAAARGDWSVWGATRMTTKKTRSSERVFISLIRDLQLRQDELNAGLDGEVVAAENGHGGEGSMLALRVPALLERRLALASQSLTAHRGGEHAALAPAPHFLAGEVLHHEIVGLTVGEAELQHLRRVVTDAQGEVELVRVILRSGDVESGDNRRRSLGGMPCCGDRFFVVGKRRGGECYGCGAQQGENEAIVHYVSLS